MDTADIDSVPISDVEHNFTPNAQTADENIKVSILKDGKLKYILFSLDNDSEIEMIDDEKSVYLQHVFQRNVAKHLKKLRNHSDIIWILTSQ